MCTLCGFCPQKDVSLKSDVQWDLLGSSVSRDCHIWLDPGNLYNVA